MSNGIKKIHLIRTYVSVGTGGPIPPLELLYVASQLQQAFGKTVELKLTDTGIDELGEQDIRR
ncbi:MAG: hypothetical protein K8I00_00045, partial [Candidatus Omnitrophica bacterium]|nr:hypothetical protein [Candidatus Omnitrophota bacterium]